MKAHPPYYLLALVVLLTACSEEQGATLNDVHSRLNETSVAQFHQPVTTSEVVRIIQQAKKQNHSVSISGGRHAMGGQQFGRGTVHISMKKMNDVISLDSKRGIVRVEAGIEWPDLVAHLVASQQGTWPQWGIVQKQTGGDRMSIGGSMSANAHTRGLNFKPMIQDIEAFTLVNADGELVNVSREENKELFSLVIGGYGLFGVITEVDLRLQKRHKLKRVVEVIPIDQADKRFEQRIAAGYTYGDFQYKTDENAEDFMRAGVFSTYLPMPDDTAMPEVKQKLDKDKWNQLLALAHTNKSKAFKFYSDYYMSTDGNIYWSDTHQLSYYNDEYHEFLEKTLPAGYPDGSLMITEAYVPRDKLTAFMDTVSNDARTHDFNIIYGTIRLIKKDDESFLAWAKDDYACIIFNLRVEHSDKGIAKAKANLRRIIDRALEVDGSYFLTYHRWARKDQVLEAYPQFVEFLKLKLEYDPEERFQSEWYRHYKKMFLPGISQELNEGTSPILPARPGSPACRLLRRTGYHLK